MDTSILHPRGAEASAILYSLVITAKENGLEPYDYLRFVLENLPNATTPEAQKTTANCFPIMLTPD
ncbi:hypothetical protein PITCH_A2270002 [uncultured Desulfobacterium sp.]|uniref:Transposase IS66 C-terminal domain-containing protein n=1 Tax=uncultured Desulfobacterium sp. TaxID=201089 RepID=A0A445MXW5_9BACT|nr:hypothetical protein PITCH_A2270002 [uncultured Desulfobacterium sp.]